MSRRLHIHPWLSDVEFPAWTQDAKTRPEYQRRLTVWLAYLERWPAHRIAQALGVSVPAIWRWVGQYNRQGPDGLERAGRGGRRWAFLNLEQEHELLTNLREGGGHRRGLTALRLKPCCRPVTGREGPLDYV